MSSIDTIGGLAFSPDGHIMACATGQVVILYDTRSWSECGVLKGHEREAVNVRFFPSGRVIASSDFVFIRFWDLGTKAQIAKIKAHSSWVYSLAITADGKKIASVGNDDFLRIWSVCDCREVGRKRFSSFVQSVAFSPRDGRLAVSCGTSIRFYDVETMKEKQVLKRHKTTIQVIAFSSDGLMVASGDNGTAVVKVWQVASGDEKLRLTGHTIAVWALAFSPDSMLLATGGEEGSVRLWNTDNGEEIAELMFPEVGILESKAVNAVAFSPDGNWLAAGGSGKMLQVWNVK